VTRVLLCCGDGSAAYGLRQAIATEGVEVVAQVLTSQSALTYLAETDLEVDVAVVDDAIGPMRVWDLVREIGSRHPRIGVVAVVDDTGPTTFAAAMDAGARGLVRRPVAVEEMQARVHGAAAWAETVRRALGAASRVDGPVGSMVVVAGSKGGVGTTTLATHLALLAQADDPGRSVCLVDLDLQKGDVPSLLDIRHRRDITDLVPVAEELSVRALSDVLFAHPSGLRILLSPIQGEDAEEVREMPARLILGTLRSRFDVVIVDVGSTVSEASLVAVEMCDDAYVVATPDVLGLRGVRRLTGVWERLSARKEEQVTVVLNRVDKRSDIQPDTARRILGLPVLPVHLPAAFRGLEGAVNRRDPGLTDARLLAALRELAAATRLARPLTPEASRRRRKQDAGQAVVELPGIFLMIMLVMALLWQGGLMTVTWTLAGHAASEAARAAAVGADVDAAARRPLPGPWQDGLSVSRSGSQVTVRLKAPLLMPGARPLDLPISASASMVREP
jgi:pilus assembly protein CpaE